MPEKDEAWVVIRWRDDAGVQVREKGFALPPAPAPGMSPEEWEGLLGSVSRMNRLLDQTGAVLFPRPTIRPYVPRMPEKAFPFDHNRLVRLSSPEEWKQELIDELRASTGVRAVYWLPGSGIDPVAEIEWDGGQKLPARLDKLAGEQGGSVRPLVAYRSWGPCRVEMEEDRPRLFLFRFAATLRLEESIDVAKLLASLPGIESVIESGSSDSRQVLALVKLDWDAPAVIEQLPQRHRPQELFELADPETPTLPDLSQYFSVSVEKGAKEFIDDALKVPWIRTAYLAPLPAPPPSVANYYMPPQSKQLYLASVRARAAWERFPTTQECGEQVTVALIDHNWDTNHVELVDARITAPATRDLEPIDGSTDPQVLRDNQDHGLAALGVLLAKHETTEVTEIGMRGLAPGAAVRLYAAWAQCEPHWNVAAAIERATNDLNRGDVILIEQQTRIPATGDDFDLVPVEHYPAEFEEIYTAVRGPYWRIVIEPAGNGNKKLLREADGSDGLVLHDEYIRTHYPGRNSGAVMVGAGDLDRCRLDNGDKSGSNYGEFVDVQANGVDVGTLGGGDLNDTPPEARYTGGRAFGMTSSASAIVAGVSAALQSCWKRRYPGWPPLTPNSVRYRLIHFGDDQEGDSDEHIGPRPTLGRILEGWPTPL